MSEPKNEIKRVFQQIGEGAYRVTILPRNPPRSELEPKVYVLNYFESQQEAYYYLSETNEFTLPERVYGDVTKNIAHFFKSFCLNNRNLGTLLVGERGSGKTITLKGMAQEAIRLGMPVIIINQPYRGDMFISFLTNLKQECLICFDEFCKTYSELAPHGNNFASKAQDSILQILDGANSSSKKMYVFTVNDLNLLSPYLQDRPGRVRYVIRFKHMEVDTVADYVKENLKNFTDDHLNAFIHMALAHTDQKVGLNFDSMSNFVLEMNQFDYDLNQCLEIMATNGKKTNAYFEIKVHRDGKDVVTGSGASRHEGAYLGKDSFVLPVSYFGGVEEGKHPQITNVELTQEHFVGYVAGQKNMIEMKKDGITYLCRYIDRDVYHGKVNGMHDEVNMGRQPWRSGIGFRQTTEPY